MLKQDETSHIKTHNIQPGHEKGEANQQNYDLRSFIDLGKLSQGRDHGNGKFLGKSLYLTPNHDSTSIGTWIL